MLFLKYKGYMKPFNQKTLRSPNIVMTLVWKIGICFILSFTFKASYQNILRVVRLQHTVQTFLNIYNHLCKQIYMSSSLSLNIKLCSNLTVRLKNPQE